MVQVCGRVGIAYSGEMTGSLFTAVRHQEWTSQWHLQCCGASMLGCLSGFMSTKHRLTCTCSKISNAMCRSRSRKSQTIWSHHDGPRQMRSHMLYTLHRINVPLPLFVQHMSTHWPLRHHSDPSSASTSL